MTIRAKSGGEIAPNGEFYKGGQFINTVEANPKKASISNGKNKVSKVEVAPYKYVSADLDQRMKCIYNKLVNACKFKESSFKSGNWKTDRSTVNHGYLEYIGMSFERFCQLADLFDGGEYFEI